MAQPQDLPIARAVFVSALLRSEPGVPEFSRDDATLLARTLLRTANICTVSNIKLCASRIRPAILPSATRTAALLKYLTTLAKSFTPPQKGGDADQRAETTRTGDENEGLGNVVNGKPMRPPDAAWKRLHLLYVVHDILGWVGTHTREQRVSVRQGLLEQVRGDVGLLVELAACGGMGPSAGSRANRTVGAVLEVIGYWRKMSLFDSPWIDALLERAEKADSMSWDAVLRRMAIEEENRTSEEKRAREAETKWMVPVRHGTIGDPTAPWHDLPAANGLYLKRTRGYPLRARALPQGGFPLRNGGREAPAGLKDEVTALHASLLQAFEKYTDAEAVQDVDALGNIIWKDPERPTRNYWGFSLEGIERRKEVARGFVGREMGYADLGPLEMIPIGDEGPVGMGSQGPPMGGRGRGWGRGRGRGRGRGW